LVSDECVPIPLRHQKSKASTRDLHNHYTQQGPPDYPPRPIPQRAVTDPFINRSQSLRVNIHFDEEGETSVKGRKRSLKFRARQDEATEPQVARSVSSRARIEQEEVEEFAQVPKAGGVRKQPRNYEKDFDWHAFKRRNNAAKEDMWIHARIRADLSENFGQQKTKSPLQPSTQSPIQPSTESYNPRNSVAGLSNVLAQQTAAGHNQNARQARDITIVEDIRLQNEPSPEVSVMFLRAKLPIPDRLMGSLLLRRCVTRRGQYQVRVSLYLIRQR